MAEGFTVALLPEDGLLTVLLPELGFVVADGFAVALGFDTVLPVELEDDGLLAVLALAVGLLLATDALLSCSFSDTELLTALDISVVLFSVSFPFAQAVTLTANNAQRIIVVILFSILNNASFSVL